MTDEISNSKKRPVTHCYNAGSKFRFLIVGLGSENSYEQIYLLFLNVKFSSVPFVRVLNLLFCVILAL